MNNYVETIIRLSKKSLKYNDVPVGAIIVKNGKIISKGYNTREKTKNTLNHAEIVAIKKANKKLKGYFLYDCDMYVTLKPCEMCEKVINNARINNVFYLLEKPNNKKDYSQTKMIHIENNYEEIYRKMLGKFFNKMR